MSLKGTYASYKLTEESANKLHKWCLQNNIVEPLSPKDFHVTTVYSLCPLPDYKPSSKQITLTPETYKTSIFGNALVLEVYSKELQERHNTAWLQGGIFTFPQYKPHITLSYNAPKNEEYFKTQRSSDTVKFSANQEVLRFPYVCWPGFDIVLSHEIVEDLRESESSTSILSETTFDPKTFERLKVLLRAGLVPRLDVQKAIRALKDPKKSVITSELRNILVDILQKLVVFVSSPLNANIFHRMKMKTQQNSFSENIKLVVDTVYINEAYINKTKMKPSDVLDAAYKNRLVNDVEQTKKARNLADFVNKKYESKKDK